MLGMRCRPRRAARLGRPVRVPAGTRRQLDATLSCARGHARHRHHRSRTGLGQSSRRRPLGRRAHRSRRTQTFLAAAALERHHARGISDDRHAARARRPDRRSLARFRVGAGQDAVSLRGRGAWVDGRFTLSSRTSTRAVPGSCPGGSSRPDAWPQAGRAALEPACLVYEAAPILPRGSLAAQAATGRARRTTESFPLEALDPGASAAALSRPAGRRRERLPAARASPGPPTCAPKSATRRSPTSPRAARTARVKLGLTRLTLAVHRGAPPSRPARRGCRRHSTSPSALEATRVAGRRFGELPVSGSVQGPDAATQPAAAAGRCDRQRLG